MGEATVQAVVDGVIRFNPREMHPRAVEHLLRDLSFPNPEYISRVRYGRWVGATPEEISLLEEHDGLATVPRGAVALVREAVRAAGQDLAFDDRRTVCPEVDYEFSFELRSYQEQAVMALINRTQGCAVVPCGGGKTVIGTAAIARTGQPALILVHTHDLVEQWSATVKDALGLDAGVVAGGRCELRQITVATVQSLITLDDAARADLGARFGTVILDEAHHAPASVFREVLSWLPGKYRFGLTATPERSDGLTPMLHLCIGPELFRIDHQQLVDAGHLVVPRVVPVSTGATTDAETHAAIVGNLANDPDRNRLIVELVAREARAGCSVLVLSGRVDHCQRLAKLITAAGTEAAALTSKVAKHKRSGILDRFRDGSLKVVCATSLADEGLDVSRLERLVLATPARAEGRTIQRLGRLMRPHPGKRTPVLYDLVDDIPLARRQFAARKRAYRKVLGMEALERSSTDCQTFSAPEGNDEPWRAMAC
jgi:superfamily II DNA or RNA helicase